MVRDFCTSDAHKFLILKCLKQEVSVPENLHIFYFFCSFSTSKETPIPWFGTSCHICMGLFVSSYLYLICDILKVGLKTLKLENKLNKVKIFAFTCISFLFLLEKDVVRIRLSVPMEMNLRGMLKITANSQSAQVTKKLGIENLAEE